MRTTAFLLAIVGLPALTANSAQAFEMPKDEAAAQFVSSNVVATLYHELGHGLIDVLQLPVLGREEDAADSLSALLTHEIWDEDSATQIIYDTAYAYSAYAQEADQGGWELAYADTHSLDLQRYYNLVCQFYGADPEVRQDVADELELPAERAEGCADEFALMSESWGGILSGLTPTAQTKGLVLVGADTATDPIAAILAEEITALNENLGLPQEITVSVAECGEANAYYAPDDRSITICTEYAPEMLRLYKLSRSQ
jgi:hypothetical protein